MQPFRRDRRGNVAMMTGLLAVPLLGLIGLGIDFSTATTAKSQLDAAADAAALVATTNASNAYLAGAADPITPAQAAAAQRFLAQAGIQAGITIASSSVVVQQAGTLFTANVTYQASVRTVLAGLFGVSTVALAGASTASLSINPYVDIQVLMDVSSSMTIAATQTDINQMQALTAAYTPTGTLPSNVSKGEACAFACHWTTTGDDYFALANRNGVQLRINVLRSAVGNLITNVAAQNTQAAFRLGLYTFSQKFNQIYPLSGQIGAAANALSQISPDVNDCSSNCPDTYFSAAMAGLASVTGNSGNGASQAQSQKFLFIVTDGLVDQYSPGRTIQPVQLADCAAVKAKGITILTLYTPYLPLPTNAFYNQYVAPLQSKIGPALQACATAPTLYFQAASATDIDAQLRLMLASVLQTSGHLTR